MSHGELNMFEMFKIYKHGSTFDISRPTKRLKLSNLKKCINNLDKELMRKCILRSSEEENKKIFFYQLKRSSRL